MCTTTTTTTTTTTIYGIPVLLAVLLYINTLQAGFVYDDHRAVLGNIDVVGCRCWYEVWTHDFWGSPLSRTGSHGSWRPLTTLSFRLNVVVARALTSPDDDPEKKNEGGTWPPSSSSPTVLPSLTPSSIHHTPFTASSFHAVNVILHASVTAAYVGVLRGVGVGTWVCLGAGVLFAIHPVHVEAVAGVVGRAELLSALAFCLALAAYTRYLRGRGVLCGAAAGGRGGGVTCSGGRGGGVTCSGGRGSGVSCSGGRGGGVTCSGGRGGGVTCSGGRGSSVWCSGGRGSSVSCSGGRGGGVLYSGWRSGSGVWCSEGRGNSECSHGSMVCLQEYHHHNTSLPSSIYSFCCSDSVCGDKDVLGWKVPSWAWLGLSVVGAGVGMACKEQGVTALGVALLLHTAAVVITTPTNKNVLVCVLREVWPGSVSALILVWLRVRISPYTPSFTAADNPAAHAPQLTTRVMSITHSWAVHAKLLMWPATLSFDWSQGAVPLITNFTDPANLETLTLLVCLITLAVKISWACWRARVLACVVPSFHGCLSTGGVGVTGTMEGSASPNNNNNNR
ncbi:hypothetical protein Pmani_004412 [Petrolisthes manimaculis]|uniref:DUF1736 domain-containing protein n=1 Tax=Petrolisthes manimaculis TaxID=1843537 RepID=A0AAE1QGQ4_9EUCA|nr:hypothetical protein Pmani_004412 [Petrolisthes manimaculis]